MDFSDQAQSYFSVGKFDRRQHLLHPLDNHPAIFFQITGS